MAVITKQELEDAATDALSLEQVVNGSATLNGTGVVTTRTGTQVKTLAKVVGDAQAINISDSVVQGVLDTSGRAPLLRNLFDASRAIAGKYVDTVGGLSDNAGYTASDLIPILASTAYKFSVGVSHIAYYNFAGTFVSYVAGVAADTTLTTPSGVAYMRFSQTTLNPNKQMLVKGTSVPSAYLAFGYTDPASATRASVTNARNAVKELFPTVPNLFDKNRATDGTALASNGVPYSAAGYYTTDYTAVTPGGQFVINNGSNSLCYYDENKVFVSQVTSVVSGTALTAPASAYYVRFHINGRLSTSKVMLVEGTSVPSAYKAFAYEDQTTGTKNRITVSRDTVNSALSSDRNIFDKTRAQDDKAIASNNGSVYTASGWFVTALLPVTPGGKFVSNKGSNSCCFFDYSGTFISGITNLTANRATDVPADAWYIQFQINNLSNKDSLYVVGNATVPVGYKSFGAYADLPWQGKQIVFAGDSITEGALFIPKVLALTGLSMLANYGKAGRPVRDMTKDTNGTALDASALTNADILHILGGTNDYGGARALGTIADAYDGSSVASFYNDVYQVLSTFYTLKPSLRIVFSTPMLRGVFTGQPTYPAANGVGATLPQYVQAIKEICALFGTPVCDLFSTSGINLKNLTTFTADNLHPNSAGGVLMARPIAGKINEN